MEPLVYMMAILGCADGGDQCREARVAPVTYASVQACNAAMPDVLARNTDLSFPTIAATCQSNRERAAQRRDRSDRAEG